MQNAIWTKTASYGTVETNGAIVTVNGKFVANAGMIELNRSKWITKDGITYTHLLGGKVAMTATDAAEYDAAYRAMCKATVVVPSAESLFDLDHEMSKENSRW